MLYQSTRGRAEKISFEDAIIKGIAVDGGLYVPERIPKVSLEFIEALADMDYAGAATEIFKLFTDGFDGSELAECAASAYNERSFDNPDVTPLHKLDDGLYVLELFHGPTAAFKDVALQLLPPLLTRCLSKSGVGESVAILVATSGDTGKAALEGFRDVPGTYILVFYPKDGVSEIQKLQMVTQAGENVSVAAVEGNFDDAQSGVKAIFTDEDANRRLHENGLRLSSANSINWGRLMPQIVYYFRAYTTLMQMGEIKIGDPVNFAVPTGNFGDILAGWYAREMGLPVARFICASNSNNVLTDFINTGVYDKNRDFSVTISPAMDILISSNLERLLFEISNRDPGRVAQWMEDLAANGRYDVGPEIHKKVADIFYGGYATEKETCEAVGDTFRRYNYLIDTHTAVGIHVLNNYAGTGTGACRDNGGVGADGTSGGGADAGVDDGAGGDGVGADGTGGDGVGADGTGARDPHEKTVVIATASPYKFARDVYLAVSADRASATQGADSAPAAQGADRAPAAQGTDRASAAQGADRAPAAGEAQIDECDYIDLLSALSGTPVPAALHGLRDKPQLHFTVAAKEQMKETAISLLTAMTGHE